MRSQNLVLVSNRIPSAPITTEGGKLKGQPSSVAG